MGSTVCIMRQLGGRTAGRPSGKAGRCDERGRGLDLWQSKLRRHSGCRWRLAATQAVAACVASKRGKQVPRGSANGETRLIMDLGAAAVR